MQACANLCDSLPLTCCELGQQLLVLDVPPEAAPGSQPPNCSVLRISSAPLRPQPHSRPVLRMLRLLTPAAL